MKKMKMLLSALVAAVSLGLVAGTPTGLYVNYQSVQEGAGDNINWTFEDNWITLKKPNSDYVISGVDKTHKVGIRLEEGGSGEYNVLIKDLTLTVDASVERGAFVLREGVSCTLRFRGTCTLRSGRYYAGIEVPSSSQITIKDDDLDVASLYVTGGKYGAGIGGAHNTRHPGAITIDCDDLGFISATGNYGAGIGGGEKYTENESQPGIVATRWNTYRGGDCFCPIVINGGRVEARGSYGSAGIGGGGGTNGLGFNHMGGSCTSITINGGWIEAYAGNEGEYTRAVGTGAGIGSGAGAKESRGIRIRGGTVYAVGGRSYRNERAYDYALGGSLDTQSVAPVQITGGSVYTLPGVELAASLCNDSFKPVYPVTLKNLPANRRVFGATVWRLSSDPTDPALSYDYGMNELSADANGELHLWLPKGLWQIALDESMYYRVEVDENSGAQDAVLWLSLRFDANGGMFPGTGSVITRSVAYGTAIGDAMPTPMREEYYVSKWIDAETGLEVTDETVFFNGTTVRACWAEKTRKPKAVLVNEGRTLQFVYDAVEYGQKGRDWFSVVEAESQDTDENPPWSVASNDVTRVVFDASFKDHPVTHCGRWFAGFYKLSVLVGLNNLNLSGGPSLKSMFERCSSLHVLDLSSWDTSYVVNMDRMFFGCGELTTIYVSEKFTTVNAATPNTEMFFGCFKLQGGRGTRFASSPLSQRAGMSYARLDGGPDSATPGYFTLQPKVVVEDGGRTLRFVCDGETHGTEDLDWYSVAAGESLGPSRPDVPWFARSETVTKVVIDPSFRAYRSRQCKKWFAGFGLLKEIEGLGNLDTSAAVSMSEMFSHCPALETLDLMGFSTANVTDMSDMFSESTGLKTIYATENFVTDGVNYDQVLFRNNSRLVGGRGTAYAAGRDTKIFARLDGGLDSNTPGLFTTLAQAVLEDDGRSLRFVFDGKAHGEKNVDWFSVPEAEAIDPDCEYVPWYSIAYNITNVVIDSTFADYRPSSCAQWFYSFNMTSVEGLEYLNTSQAKSFDSMFSSCDNLQSLDLSGFSTANVTNTVMMFFRCPSLTTITTSPAFDLSDVTKSRFMFDYCTALVGCKGTTYDSTKTDKTYARIDRSGAPGYFSGDPAPVAVWDADARTLTFYYDTQNWRATPYTCFEIDETAESPAWESVSADKVVFDESFAEYRPTTCAYWFRDFSTLTEIEGIENLNVSEATSLRGMFDGCSSLERLDLTRFDTSNVTDMTDMFRDCGSLTSIAASDSFVTTKLSDPDQRMFYGCTALVGGNGTSGAGDSAVYARIDRDGRPGYFSERFLGPAAVDTPDGRLVFYYDALDHSAEGEVFLDLAERAWLNDRAHLNKIVFDASFAAYRPTSLYMWFYWLDNVTSIEGLENLNTSSATSMSYLFDGCSSLTELDLSSFDTRQVTSMLYMFWQCTNLQTIVVGDLFVTDQLQTSGSYEMFGGCTSLVGGNGTVYDPAVTDKTYARIDRDGAPGYFSLPLMARAVVENNRQRIRFVYDRRDYGTKGTDWFSVAEAEAQEPTAAPPWSSLGATVTSVVFDPSFASYRPANCNRWFAGFVSLLNWNANGNLDLSETTSLQAMFAGCTNLVLVDLAGLDTANVTNMQAMFQGCSKLLRVYADAAFATDSVTESADMFTSCTTIKGNLGTTYDSDKTDATYARIDADGAPGYFSLRKTAKVVVEDDGATLRFVYDGLVYGTKGTDWFAVADAEANDPDSGADVPWVDCGNTVTKVIFDTSFSQYQPRHLTSWFWGFDKLTAITGLGNLDTSAATSMAYLFDGCSSLVALDLRGFNTGCVTSMYSMFGYCTSLKTIYATEDDFMLMSLADPNESVFPGCTSLVGCDGTAYADYGNDSAEMARIDRANHGGNGGYFSLPPVAKVVLVDFATLRFVYDGNDYEGETACWDLASDVEAQPSGYMKPWWQNYKNLITTVVFDDSFKGYRPKNCEAWFSGLANLNEIQGIENLDTSAVRNMGSMFSGCARLESVDMSGFDTSSVTNMSWMFSNCSKLESLDVSGYDTSKVTDMTGLFASCRVLAAVDVSGFDTSSVTGTGLQGVFENCSALTELDLSSFDTAKATDLSYMFNGCSSLETIYVGAKFVTAQVTGSECMFANCTSLVGGNGTKFDAGTIDATYARIDTSDAPGYFSSKGPLPGSFAHWANEEGLAGADAAWDAKPAKWGGQWENAFIYTYGKGLVNGSIAIMSISFDADGKPVITTTPRVYGHDEFTPAVIGTSSLENWTSPIVLERDGDNWTLPVGQEANFFRVRLSDK